jgi:GntR family transcriptional regulator of vanillate catabolism
MGRTRTGLGRHGTDGDQTGRPSPELTRPLADPPQTEPATHTVLTHLREMIVTGQIPPETRLRAEGLATELAVSRTPIRSALAVLSAEGLVDYGINRGYTVRAVTIGDVFDSIEVRAGLEGQAARMSVDLGWEAPALERLADMVRQGAPSWTGANGRKSAEVEWYELNHAFHRTIHHASQNTVLRNAIRMTLIYPVFGDPARLCPSVAAAVPLRLRQVRHDHAGAPAVLAGRPRTAARRHPAPGQRRGGPHHDRPCSRYETSSSRDRHPPLIMDQLPQTSHNGIQERSQLHPFLSAPSRTRRRV